MIDIPSFPGKSAGKPWRSNDFASENASSRGALQPAGAGGAGASAGAAATSKAWASGRDPGEARPLLEELRSTHEARRSRLRSEAERHEAHGAPRPPGVTAGAPAPPATAHAHAAHPPRLRAGEPRRARARVQGLEPREGTEPRAGA